LKEWEKDLLATVTEKYGNYAYLLVKNRMMPECMSDEIEDILGEEFKGYDVYPGPELYRQAEIRNIHRSIWREGQVAAQPWAPALGPAPPGLEGAHAAVADILVNGDGPARAYLMEPDELYLTSQQTDRVKERAKTIRKDYGKFRDNKSKIYMAIRSSLSEASFAECEKMEGFDDDETNPIDLLNAIYANHSGYGLADDQEEFRRTYQHYTTMKQEPHESLLHYRKRCEAIHEMLKELGREEPVENKMVIFEAGLDKAKYGSYMRLRRLKMAPYPNNEPPTSIVSLCEAIENYYKTSKDFDREAQPPAAIFTASTQHKGNGKQKGGSSDKKSKITCFNCGELGHIARNCTKEKKKSEVDQAKEAEKTEQMNFCTTDFNDLVY